MQLLLLEITEQSLQPITKLCLKKIRFRNKSRTPKRGAELLRVKTGATQARARAAFFIRFASVRAFVRLSQETERKKSLFSPEIIWPTFQLVIFGKKVFIIVELVGPS